MTWFEHTRYDGGLGFGQNDFEKKLIAPIVKGICTNKKVWHIPRGAKRNLVF